MPFPAVASKDADASDQTLGRERAGKEERTLARAELARKRACLAPVARVGGCQHPCATPTLATSARKTKSRPGPTTGHKNRSCVRHLNVPPRGAGREGARRESKRFDRQEAGQRLSQTVSVEPVRDKRSLSGAYCAQAE